MFMPPTKVCCQHEEMEVVTAKVHCEREEMEVVTSVCV